MRNKLDPDGIDKAALLCEKKGIIAYAGITKKVTSRNKQIKRILIIADTFITFVKRSKFSHPNTWSDITSLHVGEDKRIKITFMNQPKNFCFISPEYKMILRKIYDILFHTMTARELSKIDFESPQLPVSINPRGVLSRFDEHYVKEGFQTGINLHQSKIREFFKYYCQSSNPTFILKSIGSKQDLNSLFYALIGSPFTKAIFLPEITDFSLIEKLYSYMSHYAESPCGIQFVSFKNKISPKFDDFKDVLIKKPEIYITGIGFRDVKFTEEEADKVRILIRKKQLLSLRWCSISPLRSKDVILNDRIVSKSLRYLALDRTVGLDLNRLSPKLGNIVVLSLEACDLEISDIFRILNQSRLRNLKMLNLSSNKATKPFKLDDVIMSNLNRIDISRVEFSRNVMKNVVQFILTSHFDNGIKFYCNDINISKDEMEDVLNNFKNFSTSSILEFSWRRNKINEYLLNFLKNNSKISKLVFEGDLFDSLNDDLIDEFALMLQSLRNLTHLYICGYKNFKIEEAFQEHILPQLKRLRKLTLLDVSSNSISNEGIESLAHTLNEIPKLTCVILDKSQITSLDPLYNLVETAQRYRRKLYISWPVNDIKALLDSRQITEEDVANLKEKFNAVSSISIAQNRSQGVPTLDEQAAVESNSPASNNKGRQKKNKARSVFVNSGAVKNIKVKLGEGDEKKPDPDSLFIVPFDSWTSHVKETNFPLYLTDELCQQLDVRKYEPINEFEEEEEVKESTTRGHHMKQDQNKSVLDSANDNNDENKDDSKDENKDNNKDENENKGENENKDENGNENKNQAEQTDANSDVKFKPIEQEIKPLISSFKQPLESILKTSTDTNKPNSNEANEGNAKPTSNADALDEDSSEKSSQFLQQPFDTYNSDFADVIYHNNDDQAMLFEPPSWSFPIKRITRISNNEVLRQLNEKYSFSAVVNNLRDQK